MGNARLFFPLSLFSIFGIAQHLVHALGQVIHDGQDARVIHTRRPDDAKRPALLPADGIGGGYDGGIL